jgi:hypothetical protein
MKRWTNSTQSKVSNKSNSWNQNTGRNTKKRYETISCYEITNKTGETPVKLM